jgi:hypothetical protein
VVCNSTSRRLSDLDEDAIAPRGSGSDQQAYLDFGDDALSDAARLALHTDHGAGVKLN